MYCAYIRRFTEDENKIPRLSRWRYVNIPNVNCNRIVSDNLYLCLRTYRLTVLNIGWFGTLFMYLFLSLQSELIFSMIIKSQTCYCMASLYSGRNKGQKLVGRFFKNQTFCRLLRAVPLKMYSKFVRPFGQPYVEIGRKMANGQLLFLALLYITYLWYKHYRSILLHCTSLYTQPCLLYYS